MEPFPIYCACIWIKGLKCHYLKIRWDIWLYLKEAHVNCLSDDQVEFHKMTDVSGSLWGRSTTLYFKGNMSVYEQAHACVHVPLWMCMIMSLCVWVCVCARAFSCGCINHVYGGQRSTSDSTSEEPDILFYETGSLTWPRASCFG